MYLYLVKYLGEPFTIGGEGVTPIWDTAITPPDQVGWNAEDNSISVGFFSQGSPLDT
ncbi:MAG: hypothetical protein QGF81_01100 [Dehalococcoidia bacterium]|nr:hypothetical protein [Dehalococcoidia bacterium]